VSVRLWLFGKNFNHLLGNFTKCYFCWGNPLITQLRFRIEDNNMGSENFMTWISQSCDHINAMLLILLNGELFTGFSMILPLCSTMVSPQMSRSHSVFCYLNLWSRSLTFPRHVSLMKEYLPDYTRLGMRMIIYLNLQQKH